MHAMRHEMWVVTVSAVLVVAACMPQPAAAQDFWDTVREAGEQLRDSAEEIGQELRETAESARETWRSDEYRGVREGLGSLSDRTTGAVRQAYRDHGPQASAALREVFDTYGDEAGRTAQQYLGELGSTAGRDVLELYREHGPEVAEDMRDVYREYGTGGSGRDIVRECERLLPNLERCGITLAAASDEIATVKLLEKRIGTGGRHVVYRGLRYAVEDLEFEGSTGRRTTVGDVYREWISDSCPVLRGSSIAEDPSEVVVYGLLYCDTEYLFEEAEVLPTGANQFTSVRGGVEDLAREQGAGYILDVMEVADTYSTVSDAARAGDLDSDEIGQLVDQMERLHRMQDGS